jgi:hypothetical protein
MKVIEKTISVEARLTWSFLVRKSGHVYSKGAAGVYEGCAMCVFALDRCEFLSVMNANVISITQLSQLISKVN